MVMEDLQDYLMIKAMYAKSKLAFRKCSDDIDIAMEFVTQPHQTEGEGDKAAAATADGGEKKDEPKPVSVYKVDMHCEGCCKKIRRAVKHLEGVESAKTDRQSNKLTVTGEVDPEKVKARLEKKMKKEVRRRRKTLRKSIEQIVSPQPKKDAGGGGEKKADEKATEKKPEVKKPPPEETQIMVVLKIRTHCDDCITKMKKIIRKIKGVESVAVDDRKDLVTVKGTMEVKDLVPYLSEKFRTSVEVVQPKTDQAKKEVGGGGDGGGGGGEKKTDAEKVDGEGEKKNDAQKVDGGGEEKKDDNKEGFGSNAGEKKSHGKKDEAAASGDGGAMAEVTNKMDYSPAYVPINWLDGIFSQSYTVDPQHLQYGYGYNPVNQGYLIPIYNNIEPVYNHPPMNPAQMFSDDNPRACSII
ncbi:heavy metal-associated isoprenylated plant protein 3-like [Euphorbia lathyris]|uniref:heavy metal-associated isoprenylated plant protein 3-like n=1 Tax=Euphorbia lathyris TaxID=212925 RepID=UPI0033142324